MGTYFLLTAALIALVTSYHLLAPILLAFALTVLVTLAVNPLVLRIRALAGGRRIAAGIVTFLFLAGLGLAIWAFIVPIRTSTANIAKKMPEYWERVQRPLIRLEKEAAMSEAKLEQEVSSQVA